MLPLLRTSTITLAFAAFTSSTLAQTIEVYEHIGTPKDQTGRSVAGLGDLDGDGIGDYAVGSPFAGTPGNETGRVDIRSGKTGALIRTHFGQADGDMFGWAVDGLGDATGDGVGDYIIGAPLADSGATTDSGRALLFSGATGSNYLSVVTPQPGAQTGYAVCGTGDLDGDGLGDFAFGVPFWDQFNGGPVDTGRVTASSGFSGSGLWSIEGTQTNGYLGFSLDGVGDINGDGRSEVVIGAPYEDLFAVDNGRAYVIDGASGAVDFSRFGAWAGGHLGHDVAGVGDVNGDGVPDIGFGEPHADGNGQNAGRALISSGAAPHAQLAAIDGPSGSLAGMAIAGIGDADGDGLDDFALGMPFANLFSVSNIGWVYLVSGGTGAPFATLIGSTSNEYFGYALDGLGDLNGDGSGDVIVGLPLADTNGSNAGAARLFLTAVQLPETYCTSKVNSDGCPPEISYSGTPTASISDDFRIRASDVLPGVPGLMIWSYSSAAVPFGGGTLCLGPTVRRTTMQLSGGVGGVPCSGSYEFHFSHAYVASENVALGQPIQAQYWSRDTGFSAPNNMSLSDALRFWLIP